MKIKLLVINARVASFELKNKNSYYAQCGFQVFLNEEDQGEYLENCFTLYNLQPDTKYDLKIILEDKVQRMSFQTGKESALLDVCLFGADPTGKKDSTLALQAAIACCPDKGTVFVKKGIYTICPLFLKSNMMLYLDKGAVLSASVIREQFPVLPGMLRDENNNDSLNLGTWEGDPLDSYASILTAVFAENFSVCGQGEICGNAEISDWWHDVKHKRGAWRPRMIFLNRCKNVQLVGIKLSDSPSWTVHPYYCDNVDLINLQVQNLAISPNTDGINPESCANVRIIGARISVGDDCIALKSSKIYMAKYHGKRSENIVIRNCYLARGHGAIVVGSEIAAGLENLCVENCIVDGTDRGIRIKTRRGRGDISVIDNVLCKNMVMNNVLTPFVINMFYFCDPDGKSDYVANKNMLPIDKRTPTVGKICLENITCTDAHEVGMFYYGLKERPIQEICIKDVSISFAENAMMGYPALMRDLEKMKKVALFARNVSTLKIEGFSIEGYEGEKYRIENIQRFEDMKNGKK